MLVFRGVRHCLVSKSEEKISKIFRSWVPAIVISSVTQMKCYPAFCLTILSPLGKAPETTKHQFCAQCHQSIAQIVLRDSH